MCGCLAEQPLICHELLCYLDVLVEGVFHTHVFFLSTNIYYIWVCVLQLGFVRMTCRIYGTFILASSILLG